MKERRTSRLGGERTASIPHHSGNQFGPFRPGSLSGLARRQQVFFMSGRPPTADSANPADPLSTPPSSNLPPPLTQGSSTVRAMPVARPIATAAEPVPVIHDDDEDDTFAWWMNLPSWLASMVVHLSLVLVLALLTTITTVRELGTSLIVSTSTGDGSTVDEGDAEMLNSDVLSETPELEEAVPLGPPESSEAPSADALEAALAPIVPQLPGSTPVESGDAKGDGDLLAGVGGEGGGGLELRLDANLRGTLLRSGGGTPQSEEAVTKALKWLAEHQDYDGSWSFQHDKHAKCHGQCGNAGYNPTRIAATGLALLPFLGSGQTQHEGVHKRTVELGLKYLVRSIKNQGALGSLWDPQGQMYGHGLATIALCEAYGMTHEQSLREPAQAAINFIVEAQDPKGGGWRYYPQTPGDTSVVGWQLMALKSAQMAYLRVPPGTLRKTGYFLDSVQADRGALYGYQSPDRGRPATTAIGLLCRMYLGWDKTIEPLENGVGMLGNLGPSTDRGAMRNNMYYNYYATQVMHHFGGKQWERWNAVMREYLIQSQDKRGHQLGSWYFEGADHGAGAGGRLYCTALAAMTLEVYYRHMPLYRDQSVTD